MTALPASLTLRDAQAVLESLSASFAGNGDDVWRIDAGPVTQLDTSALAVLLECSRLAAASRRKLQIVNVPARMSDLAHLYGVDGLLGIEVEPVEAAAPVGDSGSPAIPPLPILR